MNSRPRSCRLPNGLVLAGLVLLSIPSLGLGVDVAAQDARQIMAESQRRGDSKSQRYEGLLQSYDSNGKVTEKRWTFERLGSHGDSKSVIRFTAPSEVKGVALLAINHPDRASDQWMWTPALERDRRIAKQDRSTRFFGTDFSFEDLEERDVDQSDYRMLGEQMIDGVSCWQIEATPKKSKSSQYTRTVMWIRMNDYVFARMEHYVKDDVVRRLDYKNIRQIQGVWTSLELTMNDLRRGGRTRLALDKVQYDLPFKDSDFSLQALRR